MSDQYRHELKYLIKCSDKDLLKLRLKHLMKYDPHAGNDGYMIRSIYFDDYWNSAFEDKEAGILERAKWRIRIYNCQDTSIKLERKKKYGSYIFKESASLTKDEALSLIEGDYLFLLKKDNELLKQFYVECITKLMKPRVIVDYDRLPFILPEGTVRVTFDLDVRAAVLSNDIFDKDLPALSCMEEGKCIMEVKFTEFLPKAVKEAIPAGALDITAYSKFAICAYKTAYLHGFNYYEETGTIRSDSGGLL
ncbi:MAG: polyphosphate polymerase domain-containing protein [Butyrivibrio sp.]|uniref:polyphosphate polymerase domain-containing protein n=1 Tax=Butyrivibrio sp. TaxID=28121 RepID=UPI0025FD2C0C|nr:polyphosphate polymerase domain-containing protein [Butyrivibrio sp.]MCR5772229.1 polyphosphate polymerase domain-containing protein [Butyrivibrio sp.]